MFCFPRTFRVVEIHRKCFRDQKRPLRTDRFASVVSHTFLVIPQRPQNIELAQVQVHTCREKHVCGCKKCCEFSEGRQHYSQKGMKMNDCFNGLVMTTTITRKSSFQTLLVGMSYGVKDETVLLFVFGIQTNIVTF